MNITLTPSQKDKYRHMDVEQIADEVEKRSGCPRDNAIQCAIWIKEKIK